MKQKKTKILIVLFLFTIVPIQVYAATLLANWSIPWTNKYFKLIGVHNGNIGIYYGPHINAHIYVRNSSGSEVDLLNMHIGKPADKNCLVIYESVSKKYFLDACKTGQKFNSNVEQALNSVKYYLNQMFSSNILQTAIIITIIALLVAVIVTNPVLIMAFV